MSLEFQLCDDCSQWAQWKVVLPETKTELFFCATDMEKFRKELPEGAKVHIYFCGAIPLANAS